MPNAKKRDVFDQLELEHQRSLRALTQFSEVLKRLRFEGRAQWPGNLRRLRRLMLFFKDKAARHMRVEEKTLFPFLEAHIPRLEPLIGLLLSEHEDFRLVFKDIERALRAFGGGGHLAALQTIHARGAYLACLLRSHLWAESEVLYSVASRQLRPEEKKRLAQSIHGRNA